MNMIEADYRVVKSDTHKPMNISSKTIQRIEQRSVIHSDGTVSVETFVLHKPNLNGVAVLLGCCCLAGVAIGASGGPMGFFSALIGMPTLSIMILIIMNRGTWRLVR